MWEARGGVGEGVGTWRLIYVNYLHRDSRSRWPPGLRRGSAAPRLLEFRFPTSPVARMFVVSVVCCHVEVYLL